MTLDPQPRDICDWLAEPAAYPHRPNRVEQIETHISRVFLAGPLVYKLKKPVKYDFLDYSALPAREHACREEVRLNRRLAADYYLGVVPIIREANGSYQIGGSGDIVDWLVEMRRLPTELTLDALHGRGELTLAHIDRLATTLAAFYRSLPGLGVTPAEYRQQYVTHVRGNFRELLAINHHLPRGVVERVNGFQLQLLALAPRLFDERVAAGRIVDGHGDLRPEHICLSDPIAIFDCLEFSADFRRSDVADELAFLAAECDFLGAGWVGPQIIDTYRQQSCDQPPPELWNFYKCYRACVRAKVAALRADQLMESAQAAAAAEAARHLDFADQYAQPFVRPLVLVVGGLAGTGKTTLATAVAAALGAELLRTDVIRQELFNAGSPMAAADASKYSEEARERVYLELFRRAAELHAQRIAVVLDGTFSTPGLLRQSQGLAVDPPSNLLAIECWCPPEVAHRRINERLASGQDASEARPETHDLQRNRWKPWPANVPQVRVDTEQPLDQQLERVIATLTSQVASG